MQWIDVMSANQPVLWVYHGPPREDEVFASWLTRLAFYQGWGRITRFFNNTFSDLPPIPGSRLFHGMVPRAWMKRLSQVTGLDPEEVENAASRGNWFTKLDMDYRTQHSITLNRYCPLCLKEDIERGESAYLRYTWSFPILVICCRHEVLLRDTCHRCGYRNGIRKGRIWKYAKQKEGDGPLGLVCPECSADLTSSPLTRIETGDPALALSRVVHDMLEHRTSEARLGGSSVSSTEFLRTISVLARYLSWSLRKDPRFTEELYPVMQQVARLWKSWPTDFNEWLTRKQDGYTFTRRTVFRSFLFNGLIYRGKSVPGPLEKYVKGKFKRDARKWTLEKAITFMENWVKRNPGKYPNSTLPDFRALPDTLAKGRLETPEGTVVKSWRDFLELLRSKGIEIPTRPNGNRAVIFEWTYDAAFEHMRSWTKANPGVRPRMNSKGLIGLYCRVNGTGLLHPTGKMIRTWPDLLSRMRKDGLDIPE